MSITVVESDCIEFLNGLEPGSVDLVFGSPPYEMARTYGVEGIARKTDDWVAWMVEVHKAADRACKGLVAFVVAGQTDDFRWSAGPALYMAELHKAGLNLRNPPIYHRVGIPGSGGPDWLRSDYEWVVCTSKPGKLPWSDNTACGHKPKWGPGGEMSHRMKNGQRVNGKMVYQITGTDGYRGGDTVTKKIAYAPPAKANPGTVITLDAGGGRLGDYMAHKNEAPFPEALAKFFVLSFSPPGGLVADCFSGSGTTAKVCKENGRNFTGCDIRRSQVELTIKRLANTTPPMF